MMWWRGFDWKGLVGWTVATCVGVQGVTVIYRDCYVQEGASVVFDDDLILHLTKRPAQPTPSKPSAVRTA